MDDAERTGHLTATQPRHPSRPIQPNLPLPVDFSLNQTGGAAVRAVFEVAEKLHRMTPDWVVFFREVLGVDGIVRRTFSRPDSLARFECSPEYARIREMLDDLRRRQQEQPSERHKHRVITVRMPRELHETLKSEAEELRVSINTLCISKLMKLLDAEGRQKLTDGTPPRGPRRGLPR